MRSQCFVCISQPSPSLTGTNGSLYVRPFLFGSGPRPYTVDVAVFADVSALGFMYVNGSDST